MPENSRLSVLAKSNKSMDVRAKQGRCFLFQVALCFVPRYLNRSAALIIESRLAGLSQHSLEET